MKLTDFHANYFAHELTKRRTSDSVKKLAAMLADAQVDLNPHQVEAAKKAAGLAPTLPEKLEWQRAVRTLEGTGRSVARE